MKRWYKTLCEYDVAHPGYGCEGFRWGRKGIAIAALICVLAMMAGCSGVNMALDTPADGFDRIISANGSGYGDNAAGVDDAVDDSADTVTVTPAVDVSNDSDVVVQSVVDDSGNESAVPQVEGDGLTWPEAGFTGETTITYDANGKGTFADGATTNVVTTKYAAFKEVTKYAHTDNLDDVGEVAQNGGYGNNKSFSRVVTIPGASRLTVDITYQTESTRYDWVCAYVGGTESSPAGDAQCSTSLTGKLGGTTKTTKTFTVTGDSVTFWFKSDGSSSNYYGYYAVVKGSSGSRENVSGEYAVPVDPSGEYKFASWNTKPDGTGENLGAGEVYLPSSQTVYAQWESNYTKWNTVGWMITDDGVLKIRPWKGDTGTTGSVTSYNGAPWYNQASKIKKVESTGNIVLNANSVGLFSWCSNLTDISPLAFWNVSNVTNMSSMFAGCSSLTDLTALKDWNVSKVMYMSSMFNGCSSLTDLTALKDWDVSEVTDMNSMFQSCSNLTNISTLSDWNVSKVTNMISMFEGCSSLTDLTALKSWNVSKVTNIRRMFYGCSKLTDLPALKSWNVSNVTDMGYMFGGCSNLTGLSALASWNVSKVTNMRYMFQNCSKLTDLTALKDWNVSKVIDMSRMFNGCSNLTNIFALASWNVSNITDMDSMFYGCSNLTNISALKSWNVFNVTNMYGMFQNCSKLTDLTGLEGWNVSKVMNMSYMFYGCSKLTDLTALKDWNVSKVRYMNSMFYGCSGLQKIGIPSIANGGQKLVNNAGSAYLTIYMPTIISEDFTMGPYSWNQLASEMQNNPDAFQEGTIWVKYKPSYIVSYDANGGLAFMNRSMVPLADNLTLPQSNFIRFGYQFIGWTTQSDSVSDTNPLMQPGVSWRPNNPQDGSKYTLYAQWKQVGNIGDLPTSSQTGMLPGWIQTNQQGVVGSIKPLETALVSFTNTYDPNATSLELSFAKMLDNRIPDTSFEFELYDSENHLLQSVNSVGSTVPFAPLTFSEAGDHVYYVREKAGADQMIAYDDHLIEISVSVTADPDDATKLKATAQIIGDTTFNNASKPAKLSIEKRVEGTDDVTKTFTFNVSLTDRDNKPVNGSFVTSIGDNGADGSESSSVTFVDGMAQVHVMAGQTLVIHGIDAYAKYQVSENVDQMPAGYELAQITGDTGTLAAAGHSQVVAVNEYKADPAYVTLGTIKRLVDEHRNEVIMDKDEFSFALCEVNDASLPVEQQSCTGVSDASNDGSGRVAFEQLVFDVPGTYVYRIKEVIGSDAYMQYDKHQVTAIITVTDNGQGKLVASVAYQDINGGAVDMADDSTPVFVNTTLDRGGFAITGSGPWMIAGIIAIALMTLVLAWMVLRRIMRI